MVAVEDKERAAFSWYVTGPGRGLGTPDWESFRAGYEQAEAATVEAIAAWLERDGSFQSRWRASAIRHGDWKQP